MSRVRPRVSVFVACSLDGYIATPEGSLDWLERAAAPDEDYGYDDFLASVDALAMGRGTYDHVAHLDPLPFGDRPVIVFTHRGPGPRGGVTFWSRTPEEAVTEWEALGVQHVYVDGGNLVGQFLDAGLVDDITVTVVPLLLGSGLPLFPRIDRATRLRLLDATPYPSGLVRLRYERG